MGQKKKKDTQTMISSIVSKLFKPRPGTIAAGASQKGMSASQKRRVKDFTDSFSGRKSKKKKGN